MDCSLTFEIAVCRFGTALRAKIPLDEVASGEHFGNLLELAERMSADIPATSKVFTDVAYASLVVQNPWAILRSERVSEPLGLNRHSDDTMTRWCASLLGRLHVFSVYSF